jgi:hypothetical protein
MDKKEYNKKYKAENREKLREYRKKWNQTEAGKKSHRIKIWKQYGIIFSDYDLLYDIFINTEYCDLCKVKLTEGKRTKTTRCLDHDHSITDCENVRNVLCHSCNAKGVRFKSKK